MQAHLEEDTLARFTLSTEHRHKKSRDLIGALSWITQRLSSKMEMEMPWTHFHYKLQAVHFE